MSRRRARGIFSQESEHYNYRFGNAQRRRRSRVRSRRRLLLLLLALLFLALLFLVLSKTGVLGGKDEEATPASADSAPSVTESAETSADVSDSADREPSDAASEGKKEKPSPIILLYQSLQKDAEKAKEEDDKDSTASRDWNLVLVNEWNGLPEDYSFTPGSIMGGYMVDQRIVEDFNAMISDCQANLIWPVVVGAYMEDGSYGSEVSDEHATGLAVDIMDGASGMTYTAEQGETDVQIWLYEHSWEYGFVRRYPLGKESITGVVYEPWHYRYVGKEAAQEMMAQDLCLEEYLQKNDKSSNNPKEAR